MTITVGSAAPPANHSPTADDQSRTTAAEAPVDVTLTGSDPDDDPLTFALVIGPAHGTLSGTTPTLTYTPDAGFSGDDSFTFTASDGQATSDPATVTITVEPPAPPRTSRPSPWHQARPR